MPSNHTQIIKGKLDFLNISFTFLDFFFFVYLNL